MRTIILVALAVASLGVFAHGIQRECARWEVVPVTAYVDPNLVKLGFSDATVRSETVCAEWGGFIQR